MLSFKEYFLFSEEKLAYLDPRELMSRLKKIGWAVEHKENHWVLYAPKSAEPRSGFGTSGSGLGMITVSTNDANWDKNYHTTANQLFRQFPDLREFLYKPKFAIPLNFDPLFQSIRQRRTSANIVVGNLYKFLNEKNIDPEEALNNKIVNGKSVDVASFDSGKLELIYKDGSHESFDWHQTINTDLSKFV